MRMKLNTFILAFSVMFALVISSCSDSVGTDENAFGAEKSGNAVLKISLLEENATRSAFPFISVDDFEKIVLVGKVVEEGVVADTSILNETFTKTTSGETVRTAYDELRAASIALAPGEYVFTLTAYLNSGSEDCVYEGTYEATGANAVKTGENAIEFNLKRKKLAPDAGKGNLLLTVNNDSEKSVKKVTATVSKKVNSSYEEDSELSKEVTLASLIENGEDGSVIKLEWNDLDANVYKVVLKLFNEDDLQIGFNVQYSTIVNGATSKNVEAIGIDGAKNPVYTITYAGFEDGINFANPTGEKIEWYFRDGTTAPGSFTRFTDITLPVPGSENHCFLGWFETDSEGQPTGARVTGVSNNTRFANLALTPMFIAKNEIPVLTTVTISDNTNGIAQYGDTLSAVLKDEAGNDFRGTVKYQWYKKGEGDADYSAIEGATSSSYKLTELSEIGSDIKVNVVQVYSVTGGNNMIYDAVDNTAGGSPIGVDSDAKTISLGTLSIANYTYSGTFNSGNVVLADSPLDSSKLSVSEALVKDQAGNDVTASVAFAENAMVPASSGYMPVVLSTPGYTDDVKNDAVFVKVQANIPDAPALSTQVEFIPVGSIKFASESAVLEYTITEEDEPANDAEWSSIPDGYFAFEDGEKIFVRTKEVSGTADGKNNPVGFVAASAPREVPVSDENKGTLVCVTGVSLAVTAGGELRYLSTITAAPSYSVPDHVHDDNVDGTLSYKWYRFIDEVWEELEGATSASYTIGRTCIDHKIKCVITQSHPNGNYYSEEKATETSVYMARMTPSVEIVSYENDGNALTIGDTLNIEDISTITFVNHVGDPVSPTKKFKIDEETYSTTITCPDGCPDNDSTPIMGRATRDGYGAVEFRINLGTVKAKTPASSDLENWISTDVSNISYGHFKFKQEAVDAHVRLGGAAISTSEEYLYSGSISLSIAAHDGTAGPVAASNSKSLTLGSSYIGTRSVKIISVTITNPSEISLSASGKTITGTVPDGVTITRWEIAGEEDITELADVSGSALTFKDKFAGTETDVKGTFIVTVFGTRGTGSNAQTVSTTCSVVLE